MVDLPDLTTLPTLCIYGKTRLEINSTNGICSPILVHPLTFNFTFTNIIYEANTERNYKSLGTQSANDDNIVRS